MEDTDTTGFIEHRCATIELAAGCEDVTIVLIRIGAEIIFIPNLQVGLVNVLFGTISVDTSAYIFLQVGEVPCVRILHSLTIAHGNHAVGIVGDVCFVSGLNSETNLEDTKFGFSRCLRMCHGVGVPYVIAIIIISTFYDVSGCYITSFPSLLVIFCRLVYTAILKMQVHIVSNITLLYVKDITFLQITLHLILGENVFRSDAVFIDNDGVDFQQLCFLYFQFEVSTGSNEMVLSARNGLVVAFYVFDLRAANLIVTANGVA